jgi:leucyl/phenylalanyl-tRNA--protein transferase
MIPFLRQNEPFPPVDFALRRPNGLLCAGADLSPGRLLDAYRRGIFPWYGEGDPIFWWCPNPRMVLFTDELHVSRSLRRTLNSGRFEIRADTAFRRVMERCAAPRPNQTGTWILPEMIEAYCALHELGHAHCIEAWLDDELAGGIYGVQVGRLFFGESMFHAVTDASKVALVGLVRRLQNMGAPLLDCQQQTPHVASMGARPISRSEFGRLLARLAGEKPSRTWTESLVDVSRHSPRD